MVSSFTAQIMQLFVSVDEHMDAFPLCVVLEAGFLGSMMRLCLALVDTANDFRSHFHSYSPTSSMLVPDALLDVLGDFSDALLDILAMHFSSSQRFPRDC